MNPVHANMVQHAEDYQWSSARAHFVGADDKLVKVKPMLDRVSDWQAYLKCNLDDSTKEAFRVHGRTGRLLGNEEFLDKVETMTGCVLRPQKPSRKRK